MDKCGLVTKAVRGRRKSLFNMNYVKKQDNSIVWKITQLLILGIRTVFTNSFIRTVRKRTIFLSRMRLASKLVVIAHIIFFSMRRLLKCSSPTTRMGSLFKRSFAICLVTVFHRDLTITISPNHNHKLFIFIIN